MQLKPLNTVTITLMLFFTFLILFFSGFLEFPSVSTSIQHQQHQHDSLLNVGWDLPRIEESSPPDPFTDLFIAFSKWDSQVGCARFRDKHNNLTRPGSSKGSSSSSSLQEVAGDCSALKTDHVTLLVKGWTWIPDNLDNLYSCRCGLSCLWTKSSVLADQPDALLFESSTPPLL